MRYLGTPTTAVNPLGVSDAPALLDYNGFLFQRSQYRSSFPLGGYCIQNPTCPLGDILLWVRLVSLTPEQRTTPCPGESDCTIAFRNCKSFLSKRNCRRTASTDTTQRQLTIRNEQIKLQEKWNYRRKDYTPTSCSNFMASKHSCSILQLC